MNLRLRQIFQQFFAKALFSVKELLCGNSTRNPSPPEVAAIAACSSCLKELKSLGMPALRMPG
jgi:hypothetical protein